MRCFKQIVRSGLAEFGAALYSLCLSVAGGGAGSSLPGGVLGHSRRVSCRGLSLPALVVVAVAGAPPLEPAAPLSIGCRVAPVSWCWLSPVSSASSLCRPSLQSRVFLIIAGLAAIASGLVGFPAVHCFALELFLLFHADTGPL